MKPDGTRTETTAVRLTKAERAKLEMLAEATGRYPGQVLRVLLAQAELADLPDVRLKNPHLEARDD